MSSKASKSINVKGHMDIKMLSPRLTEPENGFKIAEQMFFFHVSLDTLHYV